MCLRNILLILIGAVCLVSGSVLKRTPIVYHFRPMEYSTGGLQAQYEWWIPARLRKPLTVDSINLDGPMVVWHKGIGRTDYGIRFRFLRDTLDGTTDASFRTVRNQILQANRDGTLLDLFKTAISQVQSNPQNPLLIYKWMYAAYTLTKVSKSISYNNVINTTPYVLCIPRDPNVPTYERFRFRGLGLYLMPSEHYQPSWAQSCAKLMLKLANMAQCPLWFRYKTIEYLGLQTYTFSAPAEALLKSLRGRYGLTDRWRLTNAKYWWYKTEHICSDAYGYNKPIPVNGNPKIVKMAARDAELFTRLEITSVGHHDAQTANFCRDYLFQIYNSFRKIMPKGWKPPKGWILSKPTHQ